MATKVHHLNLLHFIGASQDDSDRIYVH